MPAFNNFLDILPDPYIKIGPAGNQDETGTAGQGFASMSLTKSAAYQKDRTIGGKVIQRGNMLPKWMIDVTYNPMTKEQFDPIYNFLLEKQNGLRLFYIILPTYRLPKDTNFAAYVQANPITTLAASAGSTTIEIQDTEDTSGTTLPRFGDLFHIEDSEDSLHTKAYMVSRVETSSDYKTAPTGGYIRVHFTPQLQRDTSSGSNIIFNFPKIQVKQVGDTQEYALNSNGLYVFSLKLEEAAY